MLSPAPLCSLTYALGRSLYIPLTCRSNTRTLPETRGPGFVLPTDVVSSLLEVRRLELGGADDITSPSQRLGNCAAEDGGGRIPSSAAEKMHLPPLDLPCISHLDESNTRTSSSSAITDEMLRQDMESRFQHAKRSNCQYDSLVIAGEGEPTLRLSTLLSVVRQPIRSSCFGYTTPSTIRVVTNGLGDAVPGNSNGVSCARQMKEAGVSGVSVALMTASADQYDEFMVPCLPDALSTPAHDVVCDFICDAMDAGLDVEVTGVDRVDVDKAATEELAEKLGVVSPVRWRPYFP